MVDQTLVFVGSERGKLIAFRNIIQKVRLIKFNLKKKKMLRSLNEFLMQGLSPPVLVFVQSKERAQELFSELIYDGINVDVIHADRTMTQVKLSFSFFVAVRLKSESQNSYNDVIFFFFSETISCVASERVRSGC